MHSCRKEQEKVLTSLYESRDVIEMTVSAQTISFCCSLLLPLKAHCGPLTYLLSDEVVIGSNGFQACQRMVRTLSHRVHLPSCPSVKDR